MFCEKSISEVSLGQSNLINFDQAYYLELIIILLNNDSSIAKNCFDGFALFCHTWPYFATSVELLQGTYLLQ